MNDSTPDDERDAVLYAFHLQYERPTAEQISEWASRFPQFAADIRDHAAISWDWKAREGLPSPPLDQGMLDRGFSRVLNAIYRAKLAAEAPVSYQTFQQMMLAADTDVPKLAREWDLPRSVLADLFNGLMRPPVGVRLLQRFSEKFMLAKEVFYQMLEAALATPRLGHAKASTAPSVTPRSYEEIIRDSSMTAAQKEYWLNEGTTDG